MVRVVLTSGHDAGERVTKFLEYVASYEGKINNREVMIAAMQMFLCCQLNNLPISSSYDEDKREALKYWKTLRETLPDALRSELVRRAGE